MAIYTKKGDEGETRLFGGKKISKSSARIRAIGALDELNSYLGVVISFLNDSELRAELKQVQKDLLTIGSILGGSGVKFYTTKIKRLEREIDKLEKKVPVLTHFILPSGTIVASQLHFARTLARRAEREVVDLKKVEKIRPQILAYLNRLSDCLFVFARSVNFDSQVKEEIWLTKDKK